MAPDVHPIQDNPPDKTLLERVHFLEVALGRLWDQVWWMQLTAEKRAEYEREGFTAPIRNFYERID
jgi:hypothetical protein